MTIYKAEFETWKFSFHAYGNTKEKALQALKQGLDAHAFDYDIELEWWHNYEGDINVNEIQLNACYRDHDLIKEVA